MKQFLIHLAYAILDVASAAWTFVRFTGGEAPEDYMNVFDRIYNWILFDHDDEATFDVSICDEDGNRLRYEYTVDEDGAVTVVRRNLDANTVQRIGTIYCRDGADAFIADVHDDDDSVEFRSLKIMLAAGLYFGKGE